MQTHKTPSTVEAEGIHGEHDRRERTPIPRRPENSLWRRLATRVQPKLTVNQPGDQYEQEADRAADQVMRMTDPVSTCSAAPARVQRMCPACDEEELQRQPVEEEEEELQRQPVEEEEELQAKSESPAGGAVTRTDSGAIRSAVASAEPLPAQVRSFFEPRFGTDFSGVRIATTHQAAEAARSVRARAFTLGQSIAFNTGEYRPESPPGRRLLAHELAHVIQQRSAPASSEGMIQRDDDDPTSAAHYPNVEQQRAIQEILNPQVTSGGGAPDPVEDAPGFRQSMVDRLDDYIDRVLPGAEARRDSGLEVSHSGVQEVADIAEDAVEEHYGSYIQSGGTAPSQPLRETFQEVPSTLTPETDEAVEFWVESRMQQEGGDLIEDHNVVGGTPQCPETAPASGWPAECRDRELWVQTRDAIISARQDDLRTIILYFPAYEREGVAYIQRRIPAPPEGVSESIARRHARWKMLHSLIHEYIHTVAHDDFTAAAAQLEESSLAVEGFTEYFTGPVYLGLKRRAETESPTDTTRMDIEGDLGPDFTIPDHHTSSRYHQQYNARVEQIRDSTNEESLRVAYFMGRIEYLGLGSWNVQEAEQHEAARHAANVINVGLGAVLQGDEAWSIRASYARVFLGRGGGHQLQAGGEIGYLSEGDRIQAGPNIFYEYRAPYVYVRPGFGALGSASTEEDFSRSFRLDLVPSLEAGVRLWIFRVGAEGRLLLPVARGADAPEGVGGVVGGNLSVEF